MQRSVYAYYTSESEVSVSEIRDRLSASLPGYMIPAYMMQIEEIPVTRNGKLDKRALPEIEANTGNEYIAPESETQKMICEAFSEVLNIEHVGIKDGFFELGGHSLRATRLVNIIEEKTGVRLALKEVFTNTTPEQIAGIVERATGEDYEPIPKAEEKEYYPMSSTQKRTYLIQQMDPESTVYNMPSAIKFGKGFDCDRFEKALIRLTEINEAFRTSFLMVEGETVQKIHSEAKIDFTVKTMNSDDINREYQKFVTSSEIAAIDRFNATDCDYPKDKTVAELFEEQVKNVPEKIAVVFENDKLTYAELNARANSLAVRLRRLGINPNDTVAIITDRSMELICSIFGVIKSGGVYVPIDPTYPEDRISFMLEDSTAKAVLMYTTESVAIPVRIPVIDLGNNEVN